MPATPKPPPASRVDRRRTLAREEFVDAARAVIEAWGFQGFSLARVGEQMGLRKQALYHYFDSKEAVLFEVVFAELSRASEQVATAVEGTRSGADALEAVIRGYFNAFQGRLRLFQLSHTVLPTFDLARVLGANGLARLRPLNDLLLAGATARVAHDLGSDRDEARRIAFGAYTSVLGLLTMRSLVASAGDPLMHSDDAMLNTLVRTWRAAARPGSPT